MNLIREYDKYLTIDQRRPILERDNYTCQICAYKGEPQDGSLDVHHITPYRMGGEHLAENLVTLCEPCHQNQDREYRAQLGRERMSGKRRVKTSDGGWRWQPIDSQIDSNAPGD